MTVNFSKRAAGCLTIVGAAVASLLFAAPAHADDPGTQDWCKPGQVCVVQNNDDGANTLRSSYGDIPGRLKFPDGGSVRNNGLRDPGWDHIRFKYYTGAGTVSVCLHYPGDGTNVKTLPDNSTIITDITWGPDC